MKSPLPLLLRVGGTRLQKCWCVCGCIQGANVRFIRKVGDAPCKRVSGNEVGFVVVEDPVWLEWERLRDVEAIKEGGTVGEEG